MVSTKDCQVVQPTTASQRLLVWSSILGTNGSSEGGALCARTSRIRREERDDSDSSDEGVTGHSLYLGVNIGHMGSNRRRAAVGATRLRGARGHWCGVARRTTRDTDAPARSDDRKTRQRYVPHGTARGIYSAHYIGMSRVWRCAYRDVDRSRAG